MKGRPAEIPNVSRHHIPDLCKELGFKTIVEIGVFHGTYTRRLAQSGLKIYGIDPWLAYGDYIYFQNDQKEIDRQYADALKVASEYPNVTLIKKTSMDAVVDFPENSIDLVYIDGNHQFKYIAEDLYEWSKRVRRGGFIAGHDYAYIHGGHVKQMVDCFVDCYGVKNFWVLGRKNRLHRREWRDRTRTWMIRKDW